MRRWWLLVGLALFVWAAAATAQDAQLLGYVRDDLQLISQQSLPTWTPRWTGPIEAATILAWEAEHGYSAFVRDYNGDGIVDELDTIRLADDFGRMVMSTETQRGTTDARLVLGLAQYVAGLYPDQFVLKIYDLGFPGELLAEGLGAYSPTMVPGIVIDVKAQDPSIAAYQREMEEAEGVILGLTPVERENNTYLAGRSFLYETTPEGTTPIDLAWAEEDRWLAGAQGQVLETVARMGDRMFAEYRSQWVPVEFMLALSPLYEPETGSTPEPCPPNAIAYDVTETPTPYGRVRIEECVTRETIVGGPVLDTYTYSVTNIDFLYGSCGICLFYIPNMTGIPLTTVDMTGPAFWMQHAGWGGWWWRAPATSCGILPGDTGVFSFTVIGPTTDTWVTGGVSGCVAGAAPAVAVVTPPIVSVRTTGPGKYVPNDDDEPGDCPDLTVWIEDATCTRGVTGGGYEIRITAVVSNIGDVTANGIFVHFDSSLDSDTDIIASLDPGEEEEIEFVYTLTANQVPPCPLDFEVEVDPYDTIAECDEDNNLAEGSLYCPNCK